MNRPWLARTMPSASGCASTAARSIIASSKPGRCHGSQIEPAAEAAVELVELRPAVGARRQRDGPVGVQVIDVVERQERVERRVDGRRRAVVGDAEARVVRHHLVFVRLALVGLAQAGAGAPGPARRTRRSPIVPRSPPLPFTASTRTGVAGDRVRHLELAAGVAAAVVRDALVGAEQVGSIAQAARARRCRPAVPGRTRGREGTS